MYKMTDFLDLTCDPNYQPLPAQTRIERELFRQIEYLVSYDITCQEILQLWFQTNQTRKQSNEKKIKKIS